MLSFLREAYPVLCLLYLLLSVDHFRGQVTEVYALTLIPVGLLEPSIVSKNNKCVNRFFHTQYLSKKIAIFGSKYFKKTQNKDAVTKGDSSRVMGNDLHQLF